MPDPTTSPAPADEATIRATVHDVLHQIAPELDATALRPDIPLREQADLDSMDFLNFVVALATALGVAVPEADYPQLVTLDGCVRYLRAHGATRPGAAGD